MNHVILFLASVIAILQLAAPCTAASISMDPSQTSVVPLASSASGEGRVSLEKLKDMAETAINLTGAKGPIKQVKAVVGVVKAVSGSGSGGSGGGVNVNVNLNAGQPKGKTGGKGQANKAKGQGKGKGKSEAGAHAG